MALELIAVYLDALNITNIILSKSLISLVIQHRFGVIEKQLCGNSAVHKLSDGLAGLHLFRLTYLSYFH